MTIPPLSEAPGELYPSIGDVASIYGDPNGTYAAFLKDKLPTYAEGAWFLWDWEMGDGGLMASRTQAGYAAVSGAAEAAQASASGTSASDAGRVVGKGVGVVVAVVVAAVGWGLW
jgi:hypothetical protein